MTSEELSTTTKIYYFYEKYQNAAALKAHSSTPYFKEFFDALKSMLESAPEIEMYDELARLRS